MVDGEQIEVGGRVRAALLWDVPSLAATDDDGTRQWRRALELDLDDLGALARTDPLSLGAHAIASSMRGDEAGAAALRRSLVACGPLGALVAHLVQLGLARGDAPADAAALTAATALASRVADSDLRARLLVRLAAFAHLRGERDLARRAAEGAVAATSPDARLGLAARRWAAQAGADVRDYDPHARDCTPYDALLALPWVQRTALDAVAALALDDLQDELTDVWESGVRLGRAPFDELLAAHLQAEWCGALDVREPIRRTLVVHLLDTPGRHSAEQLRWGLRTWALAAWGRRKVAAVCRAGSCLDAASAAELLQAVTQDPAAGDRAATEVALAVWDLLDDATADAVLRWAAELEAAPRDEHLRELLGHLLRRRPGTWAEVFRTADPWARARMASALQPADLDALPPDVLERVAACLGSGPPVQAPPLVLAAVRRAAQGEVVEDPQLLGAQELLALLDWDPGAVAPAVVDEVVTRLCCTITARLAGGASGLGTHDSSELLGRFAIHAPGRVEEVVDLLLEAATDRAATASWQLGVLDGLAALRAHDRLGELDLQHVRELELRPGPRFRGESISATALRADRLRVLAPDLEPEDAAWLIGRSRAPDPAARLVAVTTLGTLGALEPAGVDWALAGALSDPHDRVVGAALEALRRRGLRESDGARLVVADRLRELLAEAPPSVRCGVVALAAARPELGVEGLVAAAAGDVSWRVRHEAERARAPA